MTKSNKKNIDNIIPEQTPEIQKPEVDPNPLSTIESFISALGSDNLPIFGGTYVGGIHIQQVPYELASCVKYLLDCGKTINSYLEIGVTAGGTTYIINNYFHPANIILIDDNQHPKSRLRAGILSNIPTKQFIGISQNQTIIDSISALDLKFDLIFIDGNHYYANVMADINNYTPFLSIGGFVCFHDTAFAGLGVDDAIKELSKNTDFTFINEWIASDGPYCGIALFRKDA